jgi:hypothetical protein
MTSKIPEMPDDELARWVAEIRPLVHTDRGLRLIKPVDPVKIAFTWDPKISGKPPRDLAVLTKIRTLHAYGHPSLFKPSIGEVLRQIPTALLPIVKFFSLDGPDDVHDLNLEREALNDGYHVAVTTLYVVGDPLAIVAQAAKDGVHLPLGVARSAP